MKENKTNNDSTDSTPKAPEADLRIASFGNGEYSEFMRQVWKESQRMFGFSTGRAFYFAENLCSELGELKLKPRNLSDVKVGKTAKNGGLTIKREGKTDKNDVQETPALVLHRLMSDLQKAIEVSGDRDNHVVCGWTDDSKILPLFPALEFNGQIRDWLAKETPVSTSTLR